MGLTHRTFVSNKSQHVVDGIYHVQNLNNKVSTLKGWVKNHFSSVSTKYLKNYLTWFFMMEVIKGDEEKVDKWWDYMLTDTKSFQRSQ